jgi:hypothetical protein
MYTVQYFERAVFEYHPEKRPPHDVLLSLLGAFEYKKRYPGGASGQIPNNAPGSVSFPATGKQLGGPFLRYWQNGGGLAQYGYPISDEFRERSATDGKEYTVQYFERAVFEIHPEYAGTPHEVLLSHLGRSRFHEVYIAMLPGVPPHSANVQQLAPRLSDSYVVWQESAPPNPNQPYSEVFALDLKTNRRTPVTAGRPGAKSAPHVFGSVVAWTEFNACPECLSDVAARDVATGATFTIATGPSDQRVAGVSGKTVLWTDSLLTRGPDGRSQSTFRLLTKQIGSDTAEEVPIRRTATDAQISEQYIVWSEGVDCARGELTPFRKCVFALNRSTGAIKGIATLRFDTFQVTSLKYVLAGHRLLIMESREEDFDFTQSCPCKYYVIDLHSGHRTDLPDFGSKRIPPAAIHGNVIVWARAGIWGVDITDIGANPPKPRLLVANKGLQGGPVVWGDWLAWIDSSGLHVMPLSALFATSGDREKVLR